MSQDLKALCKALRLAYVADVFEEVSFRDKEQFLYDVLATRVRQ